MIFMLSAYVTLGLLLLIFLLLFGYYWTVLRKVKGFPIYHVLPYIVRHQMTRKKDVPFTNILFQIMENMYKKHAKDGLCMHPNICPILYLLGEEPIKTFLNEKAASNKAFFYKIMADGMGNGLITSNGERWKKHRKLINPAFQLGMLKEKVPLFNDHALALIDDLKALENKPSPDHLYVIKHHYFYSLCESIFGLKQNQSDENKVKFKKYFQAVDKGAFMTMYRISQPWLWTKFLLKLLPFGKQYLKLIDYGNSFVTNIITEMKKHIALNEELDDTEYFSKNFRKSFTYILLQHHLKDPSFTFEDLRSEVSTFVMAGYDTVSFTTMWCLFMLGLYPEIQEKAFQEVHSTCHNYVTFEDMNSFTYLEAVIMETLRLYPTIPLLGRSLSEDVEFGKYKAYKGTNIIFSVYFFHRDPDIYPDPEKFDPERFLNLEEIKPWQHIPFGGGNRVCIGKKYALIEMKIFLAHILRNFKITSLDKREDLQLCYNVALIPAKPLRFLITPRSSKLSS